MSIFSFLLKSLGFFFNTPKRSTLLLFGTFLSFQIMIIHAPLHSAPETKPYDKQLLRLSELLGSIHYLRELCSANDGQRWRQYMQSLLESETTNATRKARLTRSFNQGYKNYSRSYSTCTPSAQATIERFIAESADIAESLALRAP